MSNSRSNLFSPWIISFKSFRRYSFLSFSLSAIFQAPSLYLPLGGFVGLPENVFLNTIDIIIFIFMKGYNHISILYHLFFPPRSLKLKIRSIILNTPDRDRIDRETTGNYPRCICLIYQKRREKTRLGCSDLV